MLFMIQTFKHFAESPDHLELPQDDLGAGQEIERTKKGLSSHFLSTKKN